MTIPSRDLNGDGCVLLELPAKNQDCPSELTFPRMDLNGDGTISRNDSATVPLHADGSPATGPGDAVTMTDLEVFASQWDADQAGALGVEANELSDLLLSGDLTLVPDGLQSTVATSATVTLVDYATSTTIDTYSIVIDGSSHPVLTVPAGRPYTLEVDAVGPTEVCSLTVGPFSLRPGEDRRVDLDASLSVVVDPGNLRPGEDAEVIVSAASCSGDVDGTAVEVALTPDVAGGAEVNVTIITLGADGTGTTTLSGGDLRSAYELTATAAIPVDATTTRSMTATATFTVGESYELELAAVDDAASGYIALDEFLALGVPVGPSVNGDGDVGFGALVDNDDRYRIYVTEPGDDPSLPSAADVYGGSIIPADTRVTGEPELNDAGQVTFTTVRADGTDIYTGVYRSDPVGFTDELAAGVSTLGSDDRAVLGGRATDDQRERAGHIRRHRPGRRSAACRAPGCAARGRPRDVRARPQLADDGTSVVQATITRNCADYPGVCPPNQSLIFDPIILAGPDVQAGRVAIAEGRVDGFGALSDPDISPPGDVIAFVGDLNDTAGLFVSVRRPDGSWQAPIAVEGPAAAGDLIDVVRDRPTVAQIGRGPAGPSGDRVFVVVQGNEPDVGGPAARGVFVVPIDLVATGDAVNPWAPVVDRPRLVAQVGDEISGPAGPKTISRIELSDSLAAASNPAFDDEHWVAFYAEASDGSNMHVRARALAPPEGAVVPGGPGNGLRVIRPSAPTRQIVHPAMGPHPFEASPTWAAPQQVLPDDIEVLPGPHVAAVTVDDDTPTGARADPDRESLAGPRRLAGLGPR